MSFGAVILELIETLVGIARDYAAGEVTEEEAKRDMNTAMATAAQAVATLERVLGENDAAADDILKGKK